MNRVLSSAFAAAICLAAVPAMAQGAPDLGAAVAAAGRPAEQVALDAGRKPAEVLAFLGIEKGDHAADIMAGGGYYTEIMAHAVGSQGAVTAFAPNQFYDDDAKTKWETVKARVPNVSVTAYPFDKFSAPANSFDFVLMHLAYHDLYWESAQYGVPRTDPAAFLKALHAAVKPGGIVGVVDHVGPAGDTRATVEKLHRIDPAAIKADFAAAGFVLEGESDLLHMAGDDHGKSVFDPAVRGKTDRVVYRFRKAK